MIRSSVKTAKNYRIAICLIERTDMVIHEHFKFMGVKTVPVVRCDLNAPKQRTGTTVKFIIMRSGKTKKHI